MTLTLADKAAALKRVVQRGLMGREMLSAYHFELAQLRVHREATAPAQVKLPAATNAALVVEFIRPDFGGPVGARAVLHYDGTISSQIDEGPRAPISLACIEAMDCWMGKPRRGWMR